MEYWEVDLRSRKDGNTVETIFSGEWHDEAYDCLNRWYKENMGIDINEIETKLDNYIDGTDGVFADVYLTDTPHGIGKW